MQDTVDIMMMRGIPNPTNAREGPEESSVSTVCLCIYVVCTHTDTCVHTCTRVHTQMYTHVHVYTHRCTHMYTYRCTHMYTHRYFMDAHKLAEISKSDYKPSDQVGCLQRSTCLTLVSSVSTATNFATHSD